VHNRAILAPDGATIVCIDVVKLHTPHVKLHTPNAKFPTLCVKLASATLAHDRKILMSNDVFFCLIGQF
jgi:hypothetical protein